MEKVDVEIKSLRFARNNKFYLIGPIQVLIKPESFKKRLQNIQFKGPLNNRNKFYLIGSIQVLERPESFKNAGKY